MSYPVPGLSGPQLYDIGNPSSIAQVSGRILYVDLTTLIDMLAEPASGTFRVDLRNRPQLTSFVTQSAGSGTVFGYSYKTLEELAYGVTRGHYAAVRSNVIKSSKMARSADPNFMSNVVQEIREIATAIDNLPNMVDIDYTPTKEMFQEALDIMARDNIEYSDGFQHNLCVKRGITDILTTDSDFAEIQDPSWRVFTTSRRYKSLLQRLRQRTSGRKP